MINAKAAPATVLLLDVLDADDHTRTIATCVGVSWMPGQMSSARDLEA